MKFVPITVHKSSRHNKVRKSSKQSVNPGLHRKKTTRYWHRYARSFISMSSTRRRLQWTCIV